MGMGMSAVVDYGLDMSDETRIDPRYQEPLEPGWWKTASGWKAVLESNRIDRRAKPVVVAFIVAVFFLVNWVTDWSDWILPAVAGAVIVTLVLVLSPLDTPRPLVTRESIPPDWWKSLEWWRLPSTGDDDPRSVLFAWSVGGIVTVVLTVVLGWYGLFLSLLVFLPFARRLVAKRWRPLVVGLLILVAVSGFAILDPWR